MSTSATLSGLTSFPPLFGQRRALKCPPLQRIEFAAGDGSPLLLHHTSGGTRGPVIIAPGTAMTALTYCFDGVPQNLVEFLVEQGFDIWLFDWRTSPLLPRHERPYTLNDVGRFDWPSAVAEVRRRTGKSQVTVLAHCLSSPCFMLGLVRGHIAKEHVRSFVASQVALHLIMTPIGMLKVKARLDRLLPAGDMIHQRPNEVRWRVSDLAVSVLARIMPKSYVCDNPACDRQTATFGEIILHAQVAPAAHGAMADLVPECVTGFLKDVAVWVRNGSVLNDEDRKCLDRFRLPIHFISGSENRMFVPTATEKTYDMLRAANDPSLYRRTVYPGFGHLDCYIGKDARSLVWPDIASSLS